MWLHQISALSAGHRVIRYDWRGYGDSEDAEEPVRRYADLLSVLDATGVQRATLVGASDGGKAAIDAVLTAPDRITGLVLLAPGLSGQVWPETMRRSYRDRVHASIGVERLLAYRTGTVTHLAARDLDTYCRAETEFLVAGPARTAADLHPDTWHLALDMDRRLTRRAWSMPPPHELTPDPPAAGRLAQIAVPTLVINGLSDVPEITDLGRRIAEGIPGVRWLQLPDTGHLPALERPGAVNAAVLDLLTGIRHHDV